MLRATLILLGAASLPVAAIVSGTEPAPGGLEVSSTAVNMPYGCKVNVVASNSGTQRVAISRDSQVRLEGMPWKQLGKSVWLNPGQTAKWYYDLEFGCNHPRVYRFLVKKFDSSDHVLGEHWYYYPSRFGDTRSTNLDLKSLDRFF